MSLAHRPQSMVTVMTGANTGLVRSIGAGRCSTKRNQGGGPVPEKHRVNREIRFPSIRIIGADGEQLGIMSPEEGRTLAEERGLDLVEVAPEARPPVCKIMDYGKFKYEISKRTKPQKTAKLKTIKLRPKTDGHDIETKFNLARKFLADGDRVKFVMRLRGREAAYVDRWCTSLSKALELLSDAGAVSLVPQKEGRAVVAQVDPK
jgi:translation initiation factor IF-3